MGKMDSEWPKDWAEKMLLESIQVLHASVERSSLKTGYAKMLGNHNPPP